jgi:hypothetical protein
MTDLLRGARVEGAGVAVAREPAALRAGGGGPAGAQPCARAAVWDGSADVARDCMAADVQCVHKNPQGVRSRDQAVDSCGQTGAITRRGGRVECGVIGSDGQG